MRNFIRTFSIAFAISLVGLSTLAHASVASKIMSWVSGELLTLIISFVLAVLASVGGVIFNRVIVTLKEIGEVLVLLSTIAADKKVTKEELEQIKSEIRDVVDIFKKTPNTFKTQ